MSDIEMAWVMGYSVKVEDILTEEEIREMEMWDNDKVSSNNVQ